MTVLTIEIETIDYGDETLKEVECKLDNQQVIYEYSLDSTDYPTDNDVQTFIEAELAERGLSWDSVEIMEA